MLDKLTWRIGAIIAGVAFIVALGLAGAAKLGEMARAKELKTATAALGQATNELNQCQVDLARAGERITEQNTAIADWSAEAAQAQARADAARIAAAKKARQYESRIAWLKSQKETGETCPGVERLIDDYLIQERQEVRP